MDAIDKALKKFSAQERAWVSNIFDALKSNEMQGFDVKKLKGYENIFRVRRGDIRVIYRKLWDGIVILEVGRRNEKTYE
jgi:mRNA-degrading endonuclease RelE of RelBE toxin-antitoxin system